MSEMTFCVSVYNNVNYLPLAIKSVRENSYYKDSPFVVYAENCDDGTNEWLNENKDKWNLEVYIEPNNMVRRGIGGGMNFCASKVETKYINFLQADTYVARNWDVELERCYEKNKKKQPDKKWHTFSYRIQPNIFNDSPRVGTTFVPLEEFGAYHHDFDEKYFLDWCKEFSNLNDLEIRKGEGVSGMIRKTDWDIVGGNDPLFAPASWDDMDLFIRMQLKGIKIVLTSKSVIYHFGARGSHFSEDDFNKRSERQIKAERENSRNWLTKWNKYPENDEVEFVKAEGMKIIESYEGKHK